MRAAMESRTPPNAMRYLQGGHVGGPLRANSVSVHLRFDFSRMQYHTHVP